jgi:RNA polymerase sigma factor (sigma-70 family)
MQRGSARSALRQIRTLYTLGTLGGLTDAELLDVFLTRGADDGEDAFAALVDRHGPMVLGVCRRMLPTSHDAEDAFQATFLILARRAASIGRREKLAGWLHGVAVRSASEARRRAARERTRERRLMKESYVGSTMAEEPDDVLPLLDEELNRLPQRFRAALVACELEGKSRREAAAQLGLAEGTLSAHLARGRKMLRERLLRRGVSVAALPAARFPQSVVHTFIPERLIDSTVRASLAFGSQAGGGAMARAAVSTLADRVLKTMLLSRLSLLISLMIAAGTTPAILLGLVALMVVGSTYSDAARPGPDDLAGRIVDEAGSGLANAQVWAIVGPWGERKAIASGKTDGQGRFVLPKTWNHDAAKAAISAGQLGLFARASDGRIGWIARADRSAAGTNNTLEIVVCPAGEARGRVTDQDGRPIEGAKITPLMINKVGKTGDDDPFNLTTELIDSYRTTTGKDGWFVLKNTQRGAWVRAAIEAPGIGWLHFLWDSTQPATFTFDNRLGQIKGRIILADGGAIPCPIVVRARLDRSSATPTAHAFQSWFHRTVAAGLDGSFLLDNLPPGRYIVEFDANQNPPVDSKPVDKVEVGPGSIVTVEVPATRLSTITGHVIDMTTGKGIANVPIQCFRLNETWYAKDWRQAKTDADGRYSIATAPGVVKILPAGLPQAGLVARSSEAPNIEVTTDQVWPDLKLVKAAEIDGVVVDEKGEPVVGAEVYVLDCGPLRQDETTRTGPGGTFHLNQIDPDATLSLWARTMVATTDGRVTVHTRDLVGKLTLTIDPRFACQIRGVATDRKGNRIPGATVKLWWGRAYEAPGNDTAWGSVTILHTYVTSKNGWFVFRGLWPGCQYGAEIEAVGQIRGNLFSVKGQSGETYDVGNISLVRPIERVAGRVIGSDGKGVSDAVVYSRGARRETVETLTGASGEFRLESPAPATNYVFVRKDGYRFTGVPFADGADSVAVTIQQTSEPPPEWKPLRAATFDQEQAFAKQMLIRLWEKYGAKANENDGLECILAMASIDLPLAMDWAAERGAQHDSRIRQPVAEKMAETDVEETLAYLANNRDRRTHAFLLKLADRFVARDRTKALRFADAALARAGQLGDLERPTALAASGEVFIRAGRAEEGRKLLDDAVRAASQLGVDSSEAQARAIVAAAIARNDLNKALALIEPVQAQDRDRCLAFIARAIARTDTVRAVAMADTMDSPAPIYQRVKTAIAYKIGADRPDEAIKIIESIKRDNAGRWQAEAFGWLAVALSPRDRARAFGLIDRALDLITDDSIAAETSTGYEMVAAAHVAACARQIGYPDMESVVMRVIAASPANWNSVSFKKLQHASLAAIDLALIDPGVAGAALKQTEANCKSVAINPAGFANDRGRWLIASALADLANGQKLFETELATINEIDEADLLFQGIVNAAKLLATPPARRESVLRAGFYGESWRPAE